MKIVYFMLLIALSGCSVDLGNGLTNESLFLQISKSCPKRCDGQWSGLLKAEPDILKCVCGDIKDIK